MRGTSADDTRTPVAFVVCAEPLARVSELCLRHLGCATLTMRLLLESPTYSAPSGPSARLEGLLKRAAVPTPSWLPMPLPATVETVPSGKMRRHQSTGAPGHLFFVKTPAARVPAASSARTRSVRPW